MKGLSVLVLVASISFIAGAGLTYVAKTPWTSDMANQASIKPQEGPMLPPQGSVATDVVGGTGASAGKRSESEADHQSMGHQQGTSAAAGHQHGGAAAKHDHASKGSSQAMGHEHGTSAAGGHQHGGAAAKHGHASKGSSQAMGHQHGTSAAGGHQHDGAAAKHDQGSKSAAPSQMKDSQHTHAGETQQPSGTTSHPLPYDLLGSAGTGPGTTTGTGQSMGPTSGDQRKDAAGIHEHSSKTVPPAKTKDSHDNHSSNPRSPRESGSHDHGTSASSGQKPSKIAAHDHGNAGSSPGKAKHSHKSGTTDKMKAAPTAGTHQHSHGVSAGDGHAHGDMHSQAQVVNPIKPSEASVKKGQQLFNIYCSVCHGTEGRGGTPMASKIPGIPKFTPELLRSVDDNHMFSMVTSGHGPMPGYAEALTPEERWHVTNYVRTLPDKLADEKKAAVRQGASR